VERVSLGLFRDVKNGDDTDPLRVSCWDLCLSVVAYSVHYLLEHIRTTQLVLASSARFVRRDVLNAGII
jgi:hypothetical protein